MICKECGAYNPDHATFCKVCAANLKGETAPEQPAAPVEEQQPTRRFSRPSWVAPEQSERVREPEPKPEPDQEPEKAPEAVETPASEPVQEEPEEDTEVLLFARNSSRRKPVAQEEPEESDKEPAPAEESAEEDSIYNDEEALENSDESFEYEPTPPKRKQQKKKNNTLFTVLLIAIIVVIVGIIVVIAGIFLKDQLGCSKKSNDPGKQGTTAVDNPGTGDPVETASTEPGTAATQAPEKTDLDAKNAQLLEYRDENNADFIAITVVVPAKSTLTIEFPHQDDYKFVNEEERDMQRKVKIPVEVFYLNTPLEDSEVTFTPSITITGADGSSYSVNCPSFTRTFPKLNITVTAPVADENGVIMAPESNTVTIEATIDDPAAEVTINGVGTVVYQGGKIMQDFSFPAGATEDDEETITIVATKNDCVSDTKEITIHAYKFIPEEMKLEVKTDALRADKSGKLTVTGTTLPGATLTATSDNSTNVLCGSVNVDNDGNFSFQITMDPSFYGMSVITLDAVKEGAESGSTKFTVTKSFEDKNAFVKYYNKTKTYIEIPKNVKIDELLANQAQYATSSYGIRITATVVEAIEIDGEVIVKMTLNKSGETVYVRNFSGKWSPGENVGGKYNIYCNFTGTYSDTGCAEFIGWFAKKA